MMDDWLDDDDDLRFNPKDWAFLALLISSMIFVVVAFA